MTSHADVAFGLRRGVRVFVRALKDIPAGQQFSVYAVQRPDRMVIRLEHPPPVEDMDQSMVSDVDSTERDRAERRPAVEDAAADPPVGDETVNDLPRIVSVSTAEIILSSDEDSDSPDGVATEGGTAAGHESEGGTAAGHESTAGGHESDSSVDSNEGEESDTVGSHPNDDPDGVRSVQPLDTGYSAGHESTAGGHESDSTVDSNEGEELDTVGSHPNDDPDGVRSVQPLDTGYSAESHEVDRPAVEEASTTADPASTKKVKVYCINHCIHSSS